MGKILHNLIDRYDFIKDNYLTLGYKRLAEQLNCSRQTVTRFCKKHGFIISDEQNLVNLRNFIDEKWSTRHESLTEDFTNIKDPQIIYLLGFIWGDGHVTKNYIELQIQEEDGLEVQKILPLKDFWRFYSVPPQSKGHKPRLVMKIHSVSLSELLLDLDFGKKTFVFPQKLLSRIDDKLQYLFWRGLFDADGHVSKTKRMFHLYFHSECDTDLFIQKFSNMLNSNRVKLILRKTWNKTSQKFNSVKILSLYNTLDFYKFYKLIYPTDSQFNHLGLKRKKQRFEILLNENNS